MLTSSELLAVNRTVSRLISRVQEQHRPQQAPSAILLAGQPGSGKTILSSLMFTKLNNDAALINGDEYRRFHPNYRDLYEQYGFEAISRTSPFSGAVTEALIDQLSDLRFNLIIEGTGRTVEVPKSTSELLTEKTYSVEIAVIATRPILSLISTVQRFYQMNERGTIPRSTAVEAHDNVVSVLPYNLDVLRELPSISRITIWTRDAEQIYGSLISRSRPSMILKSVWSKRWTSSEISSTKMLINELYSLEERYDLGQGPVIDEIQKRFQREISSRNIEQER